MKILKIEIENFLTIGKIEANLDNKGLVLVQGENIDDTSQESNGSGKSSFPDAISWALYSETARGETGNAVINRTAGKNCRVAVLVEDDNGIRYLIARHRKHKEHKNRLLATQLPDGEGEEIDLTKGTDKLTQEVVNKIMGCSVEVFNAAVYMGQERMPDLPSMTDKMLKTLVEEAAGIDRLQAGYEIARQRLNDAKNRLSENEKEAVRAESKVEACQSALNSTEDSEKTWEVERKEKMRSLASQIKKERGVFDGKEEAAQAKLDEIESEIEKVDSKIASFSGEKEKEAELGRALSEAESEAKMAERELTRVAGELRKLKAEYESIENRIGTDCTECGKPYTEEDLGDAKRLLAEKLRAGKETLAKQKKAREEADALTSKARESLSRYRESMTDMSELVERQRALRRSQSEARAALEEIRSSKREHTGKIDKLKELKSMENPYSNLIEKRREEMAAANAQLEKWREAIEETQKRVGFQEKVATVFGPAGVRAYILDTVTPFLNSRTSHYLSVLTDGNITAVWQTLTPTAKGRCERSSPLTCGRRLELKLLGGCQAVKSARLGWLARWPCRTW